MFDRLLSLLISLSLALLCWLYLRSRDQEMLDNVPVPVQIGLAPGYADNYEVEVNGPAQIPVSFTGPPSRIRELRNLLQRGELRVEVSLTVPEERLGEAKYLDTVRVEAGDVRPPPGVTPAVVEGRNRIPVTLYRLAERRLPVRFEPGDDRVRRVVVQPATVLVRGPQEVLDRTRAVATLPYALPLRDGEVDDTTLTVGPVSLDQKLEGRPVRVTPGAVGVQLTLRPRQRVYELTDVTVHFLCPANFGLRPLFLNDRAGKISLRLLGPPAEEPPTVFAFVDLTGYDGKPKLELGLCDEPLRVQVPRDYQLLEPIPRSVAFRLAAAESGFKGSGIVPGPP